VAEIENSKFKYSKDSKCLTMVVLPEPEGAEKTNNFPLFVFFRTFVFIFRSAISN
jgi:hypothetical protein